MRVGITRFPTNATYLTDVDVQALLKKNAKVYIAVRSKTKAGPVVEELKASTGRTPIFLELDLADLAAVRRSAQEFLL